MKTFLNICVRSFGLTTDIDHIMYFKSNKTNAYRHAIHTLFEGSLIINLKSLILSTKNPLTTKSDIIFITSIRFKAFNENSIEWRTRTNQLQNDDDSTE